MSRRPGCNADWKAAEQFAAVQEAAVRCHAIAKWQQGVEKAIKALVAALRESGVLNIQIGYRHEVARFISVLIRLPRAAGNRTIQHHLHGLLDQNNRAAIKDLDALAPRRPPPGERPRRNTEYPFVDTNGQWTYPAAEEVFSQAEIQRFRALTHRIVDKVGRMVSAIRRGPK